MFNPKPGPNDQGDNSPNQSPWDSFSAPAPLGGKVAPTDDKTTTTGGKTTTPLGNATTTDAGEVIVEKTELTYADFGAIYPEDEIRADSRYVVDTVKKITDRQGMADRIKAAHVLEWIAARGILTYDWLGLRDTGTEISQIHLASKPKDRRHCLDAYTCLGFDDSAHKIDSAFELQFPSSRSISLGLDLTTLDDPTKMYSKLIRSHNRPVLDDLPNGFSAIKYGYIRTSDTESTLAPRDLVPRFVVGTDIRHTKRLNGLMSRLERGEVDPSSAIFDPDMLTMRFKTLSEIYEQSLMWKFRARNGRHLPEAKSMLDAIQASTWRSLNATMDALGQYLSPIQYAPNAKGYNEKLSKLDDLFFEISDREENGEVVDDLLRERYELAVDTLANQYESYKDFDGHITATYRPDTTYKAIITQTRDLYPSSYHAKL